MTFCSEISGPSLQFIWILKAAGYSGHWLEAVNGVIFAVLFLFARVYVIGVCLLYTSPSPRDKRQSRMPSSA